MTAAAITHTALVNIWKRMKSIEKVKYCILSFKIYSINKIDLTATWTSACEGSLLYISKISEAKSAIFNKIWSQGSKQNR